MSKFVCVDNQIRFYLPVDNILSFTQTEKEVPGSDSPVRGVEVKFFDGDEKAKSYFVPTYDPAGYCKSLQTHINLLK